MHGLGELETTVMDVLWRVANPCSVRDVLTEINHSRTLAYTTVMTVLDNLHRKGWVQRERSGRAYLYRPVEAREEAAARALRDVLASTGDPDGVLLHFARAAAAHESPTRPRAPGDGKGRRPSPSRPGRGPSPPPGGPRGWVWGPSSAARWARGGGPGGWFWVPPPRVLAGGVCKQPLLARAFVCCLASAGGRAAPGVSPRLATGLAGHEARAASERPRL